MRQLMFRGRVLDLGETRIMGIVNMTPDSFYERVGSAEAALAAARAIVADGAAVIDVGGQSYAAGNPEVAAEEERRRIVPAVEAIVHSGLDALVSVDTTTATVARAALAAGAHVINDCSGLSDSALAATVAEYDAGLVIMHLKGRLKVREPDAYVYHDVIAEIGEFLHERIERAVSAGVRREAIVVDPGLEFGKEPATDLEILRRFGELTALGYPVLLAASRKSFLGRVVGRPAAELLPASLGAAAIGIAAGARLVRTHDVAATVQLAQLIDAVAGNSSRATAV